MRGWHYRVFSALLYAEYYRLAYVDSETGENVYIHTNPNNPDTYDDNIYDPDDQSNNFRNDGTGTSASNRGPTTVGDLYLPQSPSMHGSRTYGEDYDRGR